MAQKSLFDSSGELLDFQGLPVKSHLKETPPGIWAESRHNELMPTAALNAGYELVELSPKQYQADLFIMRDRWGCIVHKWPDDYASSLAEVFDVCRQLKIG